MSELRKDPIVDRWVIIAENRAHRPNQFATPPRTSSAVACPFCEGSEHETPGEIAARREPGTAADGRGWRVRVVPNKYPALELEDGADRLGTEPANMAAAGGDLFHVAPGVGAHEVIIESPRHILHTADLTEESLCEVLCVYRDRLAHWKQDGRFAYGVLFKNVGQPAGASLEHLHSQLMVLPSVPTSARAELDAAAALYVEHGLCIYCTMTDEELALDQRMVLATADFVAFCPFASRFPFETWILPRRHASHYEDTGDACLESLAVVARQVLGCIERASEYPAYNLILRTAPFDISQLEHYHWRIEILPRLAQTAGFEWGSGCFINPVAPERAAQVLRELRF